MGCEGEGEAPRHKEEEISSYMPRHTKTPSGIPFFQIRVEGKGRQPDSSVVIPTRDQGMLICKASL